MKRRVSAPGGGSPAPRLFARVSSAWCIEGTAEYHVTPWSFTTGQKFKGLNFGGTTTVPPDWKVASVEATSPWTWNSGMMQSDTSSGPRS